MTGGRSVKNLTELGQELESTIGALFGIFGLIAFAVVVLMLLATPMPFGDRIPTDYRWIPMIFGQGVVGFIGVLGPVVS